MPVQHDALYILLSFLFSLLGTQAVLFLLKKFRVMDIPNDRSNHAVPVPRGGGIAMIASALLFISFFDISDKIILATVILAIISFIDDMRGLPVHLRLAAQLAAVCLAITSLHGRVLPEIVPVSIEWTFMSLFWIWYINLTNFMDGIDGITSMETIMIMIGIDLVIAVTAIQPYWLADYASILGAAALGFYFLNRHPAKIFMGDAGSVPLGFLTAYMLIRLAISGEPVAALILPAYYLSDATFTLAKRFMQGKKVWEAHSEHAYQQAVRKGLSHSQVVREITLLNVGLIVLAVISTTNVIVGIVMLIIAYAGAAKLIRYLKA